MKLCSIASIVVLLASVAAQAQTLEFTYQGKLNDGGVPANGTYDMQFQLYRLGSGIDPIPTGTPIEISGVTVTNGIFTVTLNFGEFSGIDYWLGMSVRPTGGASYTALTPVQKITSAPYSIRSLNSQSAATASSAANAAQLGGVAASQYVQTTDARLADARPPTAGSPNYIHNSTDEQASSNFNISGTGTADIFNAATQYDIGGNRILSSSNFNTFLGFSAGAVTTGHSNTFVGGAAGLKNTSGIFNSFFGFAAGNENLVGHSNAFFGNQAGQLNTSASNNSYFGRDAGSRNQTGSDNSIFGSGAGFENLANRNSFFGASAGRSNTTGTLNAFFGYRAGWGNIVGSNNSFFGEQAGAASNASGNTFIGRLSGLNTTTGGSNTAVGQASLTGNITGTLNSALGHGANVGSDNLTHATAIGAFAVVSSSNTIALGRAGGQDTVRIPGNLVVTGTINGSAFPLAGAAEIEAQRAVNETQQKEIERLRSLVEQMRELVCAQNPEAAICKEESR